MRLNPLDLRRELSLFINDSEDEFQLFRSILI